jgi:hypothetical protein
MPALATIPIADSQGYRPSECAIVGTTSAPYEHRTAIDRWSIGSSGVSMADPYVALIR